MGEFLLQLIAEFAMAIFAEVASWIGEWLLVALAKVFGWCWSGLLWLGGGVLPGLSLEDRLVRLSANVVLSLLIYGLFWR
ncbi:MAG: hypothetical protein AB1586_33235 [Pseudomonadota bacterium]|jgi:hypothetical protein